jgi:hypothetical protein
LIEPVPPPFLVSGDASASLLAFFNRNKMMPGKVRAAKYRTPGVRFHCLDFCRVQAKNVLALG